MKRISSLIDGNLPYSKNSTWNWSDKLQSTYCHLCQIHHASSFQIPTRSSWRDASPIGLSNHRTLIPSPSLVCWPRSLRDVGCNTLASKSGLLLVQSLSLWVLPLFLGQRESCSCRIPLRIRQGRTSFQLWCWSSDALWQRLAIFEPPMEQLWPAT